MPCVIDYQKSTLAILLIYKVGKILMSLDLGWLLVVDLLVIYVEIVFVLENSFKSSHLIGISRAFDQ